MQLTDTSVYLKEEQTMWNDIPPVWQTAFSEMWKSFCAGSPPIGAALCDADGKVILYDHNRNNEPQTSNKRISHAEVNILSRLDTSVFNSRTLTLYSTMEPCPMCMGTILMTSLKEVHSAARDNYCGMAHLLESDPYYRSKNIGCTFEGGELELVQLTVQSYFELRHVENGASPKVLEKFAEYCPEAAETAKRLYKTKWLDEAVETGKDMSEVFDHIIAEISKDSK